MTISPATSDAIAIAGHLIRDGRLVAFPTETVYGLGADATNGLALAGIFAAKGRPRFNPLIVHVSTAADAERLGDITPVAKTLIGAFWPGPLTIVVPARSGSPISELATAGLSTIALRSPDHPCARALLAAAGVPIAAPSANRSGHVSATTAQHVYEDLGSEVAMILDGGSTAFGLESTIVDATRDVPRLLRPGSVSSDTIEALLNQRFSASDDASAHPSSPGQLASHYAPSVRVRLNAVTVNSDEGLLAFGSAVPLTTGPVFNLSRRGDIFEAAATLFAGLRALDSAQVRTIAVMPIPTAGLGEAINDRLARAAAGNLVVDNTARSRDRGT